MDLFHSIILGVIEGVSEFLPISSTGHLILASNFLDIKQTEFVKTFQIAIQSGAILAVIFLYWKSLVNNFKLIRSILVAFIPTAIIGFLMYKYVKQYLLGNSEVVLFTLFIGGILLILIELWFTKKPNNLQTSKPLNLTYEKAFVVGIFQSLAIIPGVSRSASTIIGGMLMGISRRYATEFSFLLAIPTMIAATALDLKETSFSLNSNEWILLALGFIISFVVAMVSVKWLIKYIKTNNFIPFGIYRIVLSIVYFIFIMR